MCRATLITQAPSYAHCREACQFLTDYILSISRPHPPANRNTTPCSQWWLTRQAMHPRYLEPQTYHKHANVVSKHGLPRAQHQQCECWRMQRLMHEFLLFVDGAMLTATPDAPWHTAEHLSSHDYCKSFDEETWCAPRLMLYANAEACNDSGIPGSPFSNDFKRES